MVFSLFLLLQQVFFLQFKFLSGGSFSDYDAGRPRRIELPLVDPIREDDRQSFELYDIIVMSLGTADDPIDAYTKEQKQLTVDIHNAYRRNLTGHFPQGSDMQMAEYNNTLEWAANEFCKMCTFAHFFADSDNMSTIQGQNLYRGRSRLVGWPIHMFYSEYPWFDFQNLTCRKPWPKYQCGHVGQMMWHNSVHLGIARRSHCWPSEPMILLAIHYLEGGNYWFQGFQVYKVGLTCTRCPPGQLCALGLCVPERYCRAYGLDCQCVRVCKNCAKPDFKSCRCDCKPGWDWEDCSYPCHNLFEKYYGVVYSRKCKKMRHCQEITLYANCHAFCGACKVPGSDDDPTKLCCGGKVCEEHFVLDEKTCECNLMCPSMGCMYPPFNTTTRPPKRKKWYIDPLPINPKERPRKKSAATCNVPSLMVVLISWLVSPLI